MARFLDKLSEAGTGLGLVGWDAMPPFVGAGRVARATAPRAVRDPPPVLAARRMTYWRLAASQAYASRRRGVAEPTRSHRAVCALVGGGTAAAGGGR